MKESMEIQQYVSISLWRSNMRTGVYPGSFDPITKGHLDIIERGAKVFDKLIVGVLVNVEKKGLFDYSERVEMIKRVAKHIPNVEVKCFEGLLIDFMKHENARVILKGLRAVADFEYEFQMALMNNKLDPEVETVFMMTSGKYSYLSSTAVKQVAKFGGCIEGLVPDEIIKDILLKIKRE
ncbi:Phosphopantetheine adenylyltransferase [compost metagenome]